MSWFSILDHVWNKVLTCREDQVWLTELLLTSLSLSLSLSVSVHVSRPADCSLNYPLGKHVIHEVANVSFSHLACEDQAAVVVHWSASPLGTCLSVYLCVCLPVCLFTSFNASHRDLERKESEGGGIGK